MSKVRFQIAMSLDGFVAGPNQSEENPLGEGGMQLHEWAFELEAWRRPHGQEGGETNASSVVVEEAQENVGAIVMGRNMFGGGPGEWDADDPWNGWWGDDPPFHVPVYVVTHHAREPLAMRAGTTFHFVTDGVESAVAQAKEAAGDRDVAIAGGANVIQQCLRAGLVDQMELNVVPVLLHDGERLLDKLDGAGIELEPTRVIEGPSATHMRYDVSAKRPSAS
jgi:dihydrofolate reductase